MTEKADLIPNELRQAFHEIVGHFTSWRPPLPEIELIIDGKYQPMSAICELVSVHSDALPIEVRERMLSALRAEEVDRALHTGQPMLLGEIAHLLRGDREHPSIRELEVQLATDCTYKTASLCLLRLIQTQKSRYLARIKPSR